MDDILAPLVLARWAGVDDRKSGAVGLDFAPLLGTHQGLNRAGELLRGLFGQSSYLEHLRARAIAQPVLVGYSEAGREGGYLSMRYGIFTAQRALAATAAELDEPVRIQHARGGSVARGGSRLDAILRAAPAETADGSLRITEQGEIIGQNYGLRATALRTLERAFGVLGLAAQTRRRGAAQRESAVQNEAVGRIAERSRQVWRALCVEDAQFYDFFRSATPIDVIERMQIGSRSLWESGAGCLAIRATPWVFAWSQARYFLPGWYGAGTALHEAMAGGLPALRDTYREWPFFQLVVDDIEAQLARTDLDIAERYGGLASPALRAYVPRLHEEYVRCQEAVLAIKEETRLLDGDRTQQRAIELRNPYVDPMNLMQVDLLRRWRATGREDEALFQALLGSVNGIAQGLQTTG